MVYEMIPLTATEWLYKGLDDWIFHKPSLTPELSTWCVEHQVAYKLWVDRQVRGRLDDIRIEIENPELELLFLLRWR